MAPQCKGMAGWGHVNKVMNPHTHAASVAQSHHLGRICANCAYIQVHDNRHFFAEQPRNSDLYQLDEWQMLARDFPITWCYMDMCMANLRSSRGRLMKKPSELWASHECLLAPFRAMRCDGLHVHDTIEGGGIWSFANLDF